MKVKMLKSISSPTFSYATGQEVDLDKEKASQFIKAEVAVPIDVEKATKPPAKETTSTRKGRKHANDS